MAKMDIFTEGFSEELHNLFTKDYAALSSYQYTSVNSRDKDLKESTDAPTATAT